MQESSNGGRLGSESVALYWLSADAQGKKHGRGIGDVHAPVDVDGLDRANADCGLTSWVTMAPGTPRVTPARMDVGDA